PGQRNEVLKRRMGKSARMREGVKVLGEWTDIGGGRGFSLVESNDPIIFMSKTSTWADLVKMEAVPVVETEELMKLAKSRLEG
ncbi:MAG: DUF3303 family protein, partial [Bacillota bacterium]|nr:DUF3303 family protein [Bacillota bacterium]